MEVRDGSVDVGVHLLATVDNVTHCLRKLKYCSKCLEPFWETYQQTGFRPEKLFGSVLEASNHRIHIEFVAVLNAADMNLRCIGLHAPEPRFHIPFPATLAPNR